MNNKIAKLLFPTVAGTVFGFSTVLASFGTALALQSTVITSPVRQAISNVVLYLQDSSGNFIKVKIDNFSELPETKTYDPTSVLQKYSGYTLVAYTVKAGNNKSSGMGSGEGELFIIASGIQKSQLPTYNTTDANTYQYKAVYNISTVTSNTTSTNNNDSSNISNTTNSVNNSDNTVTSETNNQTPSNPVNESNVVNSETGNVTSSNTVNESTTVNSETGNVTSSNTVNESTTVNSETNNETSSNTVNESTTVNSETGNVTSSTTANESTTVNSETNNETQSNPVAKSTLVASKNVGTTQPVSVPEPGTITAIALFGLGGLLTNKKLRSSFK